MQNKRARDAFFIGLAGALLLIAIVSVEVLSVLEARFAYSFVLDHSPQLLREKLDRFAGQRRVDAQLVRNFVDDNFRASLRQPRAAEGFSDGFQGSHKSSGVLIINAPNAEFGPCWISDVPILGKRAYHVSS